MRRFDGEISDVGEIRDCPPGTVPPWVLRFAYDGEEWLVLFDEVAGPDEHVCGGWDYPYRFVVMQTAGFGPTHPHCGCSGQFTQLPKTVLWEGDSVPEAEAAFTRIEAEWRASKVAGQPA